MKPKQLPNKHSNYIFQLCNRFKWLNTGCILFFITQLFILSLPAQINNTNLSYPFRPESTRKDKLYLSINQFNYLRNYEFFNDTEDGYTLFGSHIAPQLFYYPDSNLLITGGLFARKDFGRNEFTDLQPLFSIKYQKNNLTLINGVLEGSTQHHYIEPLFDVEYRITHPNEYGTQFIYKGEKFQVDAWINWLQMQYKYENIKEKILGGLSTNFALYKTQNWNITLPYQLIGFHQGGQIDTANQPVKTFFNQALGLNFNATCRGFFQSINLSTYYTLSNDQSNASVIVFKTGNGIYCNANVLSKWGSLGLSFWDGYQFYAPRGMPIFQSISSKIYEEGRIQNERKLLFIRYAYQHQLTQHLYFDIRFEPYMDLNESNKHFELYHSMFLVYKQEFKLSK